MHDHSNSNAQRVRMGLINQNDPGEYLLDMTIINRISHPNFNSNTKLNDIALFELEDSVIPNAYVRPACLNFNENLKWTKAIATGFGLVNLDDDGGSEELMKVQLDSIDRNVCLRLFGAIEGDILNHQLCVGYMNGGKDTCQGDSGGPLQIVLRDPYCMYSVIGVTSYGRLCGYANTPGIYVNVNYFVDWIENIVWK